MQFEALRKERFSFLSVSLGYRQLKTRVFASLQAQETCATVSHKRPSALPDPGIAVRRDRFFPKYPRATLHEPLKILVVTSDAAIAGIEGTALKQQHFKMLAANDEDGMLHVIEDSKPDFLLLDAALPGTGSAGICRKLRQNPITSAISIIVITAEDDSVQRTEALESGADDCIAKPLSGSELLAHIKAVNRRAMPRKLAASLHAGPIDMDLERWTLKIDGTYVELTKKEFRILQVLLEARGRVLTREFLLQKVWVHSATLGLDSRTVDVHIGRLRRKLGRIGDYIITVRNVGFRFDILPEWIATRTSP